MTNITARTFAPRYASARMAKVLIADDSKVYVHLITGWLHDLGHEVVVASDAVQASMLVPRTQPDAVILDISMPGGSGVDVLKRLKTSSKTKHIPVLVVSGNGGSEMRDLVKRLGAADLLEKPLDCTQFSNLVSSLLIEAGATASPSSTGHQNRSS